MGQIQDTYKRKLKNILILPDFQIKLLSYFVTLFFITTACLYSTTFLFFWRMKQKGLQVGIPEGHVFYTFLENQKSGLDLVFIILVAINLLILIGVGFFISHKIAGPLKKMQQYIDGLIKTPKQAEEFRLRKGDFLREFEPQMDELKEKLK